ncbi:MAG TPA: hypothetical protein PK059_13090, partial [Cyclobacteriaceae bacterium]|nr:hypothetical protein [Cyclobacteriaceae bacterium]
DAYVIGWGYADKYSSINWTWTGGAGQSEFIKLMTIPDIIRTAGTVTFNTETLTFYNVVQLADFEIANDYASFIHYLTENGYNAPYKFGKAWKEQTFYKTGSTGGRVSAQADPPTVGDQWARK